MKPRVKTLCIPFYTIQAVIFYLLFARRKGHCDIFHSFDRPFASLAAWGLSELTGRPHIASVRGLILPRYEARGSISRRFQNRILQFVLKPLIAASLRSCAHIITKAQFQRDYVEDLIGIGEESITTIPTGVDYDVFNPDRFTHSDSILSKLSNADLQETHVVLYLGKLVPGKGADKFIQHAISNANSDNVHFLMVGEPLTKEFEQYLRGQVSAADAASRITIHPDRIPFKDIPKLISEVGAVSLLSRSGVEGVPRVLQEACVMETPIIASDVDGIASAFRGHNGCYLINRDDTSEFINAVEDSKTTSPDRSEFQNKFDIELNYERYTDIYRQAIFNVAQ